MTTSPGRFVYANGRGAQIRVENFNDGRSARGNGAEKKKAHELIRRKCLRDIRKDAGKVMTKNHARKNTRHRKGKSDDFPHNKDYPPPPSYFSRKIFFPESSIK